MKTKFFTINILVLMLIVVITSCSTQENIVYFQDLQAGSLQNVTAKKVITVQPGDQLSIMVYGDNAELASAFNLTVASGSNNYSNSGN